MATRPGYIWSGTEWVSIGQEAVVAPVAYQASAPSTPATGDIWIDSDDDVPSVNSTLYYRWKKTAAGGETSFTGTDDNSLTLAYTAGYESVFINGVLQVRGSDYTATTGTSITGLTALTAGDIVMVESVVAYSVGDTYTQSQMTSLLGGKSDVSTTGLVLVATATIGSAVSSVVVTSAFSSSYDNYRIIISNCDSSADAYVSIKFNNSTGSTYQCANVRINYNSTTVLSAVAQNTTAINVGITGQDDNTNIAFDVLNPFATKYSTVTSLNAASLNTGFYNGIDSNAASQTGFTLLPSSGTFTGGTIKVYGYK
jgi:hypothetical protein